MTQKPLKGIRIVDLGRELAASQCCRILASMGADVVKVESLQPEPYRMAAAQYDAGVPCTEEENPVYANANIGKRMTALDIESEKGREALLRLLAHADGMVTDLSKETLKGLGLDYEALQPRYPGLVYGHLDGYGMKGEESDKPCVDSLAFLARGGYMLDLNEPGSAPNAQHIGGGDCASGVALCAGMLSGLIKRKRGGGGMLVNTSLLNTAIWAGGMHTLLAQYGVEFPHSRREPPSCALATVYRCKDGEWVSIMVSTDMYHDWKVLCEALGYPELARNERFNSAEKQRANVKEGVDELDNIIGGLTYEEFNARLKDSGIAYERTARLMEVMDDPQAEINGYFVSRDYESGKRVFYASPPFKIDGLAPEDFYRTIHHGEHTREVLAELGYGAEEIAAMQGSRSVYSR